MQLRNFFRSLQHRLGLLLCALMVVGVGARTVEAGSHLWDLSEVFTNHDGTIQFIELFQPTSACCEVNMAGKWVRATVQMTQFDFPANLTGNTAMRSLLLATAGFAALPGAPTPDYIIPDNFFNVSGDTIELYFYDTIAMPLAVIPIDGVTSYNKDPMTGTWSVGLNSPTNYASETGSVDAGGLPVADLIRGDINQDGGIGIGDAIALLSVLFQGAPIGDCPASHDINGNGSSNIADVVGLLSYLFTGGAAPPAPFPDCGPDSATSTLSCSSFAACP